MLAKVTSEEFCVCRVGWLVSTTLFRPLKKFLGPYGPLKDQNIVKFAKDRYVK